MVRFFRHMAKLAVPERVRDVSAMQQEYDPCSGMVKPDPDGSGSGLVTMYKRERKASNETGPSASGTLTEVDLITRKKRKIVLVPNRAIKFETDGRDGENEPTSTTQDDDLSRATQLSAMSIKPEPDLAGDGASEGERVAPENRVDFLREVKRSLPVDDYKTFLQALALYSQNHDIQHFIERICECFRSPQLLYLLKAMRRFVRPEHKHLFDGRMEQLAANSERCKTN